MRWFLIALLAAGTAAAQTTAMYRTVGADGTVTFSDVPLNDSSERINVIVRSGTQAAAHDTATEPSAATPGATEDARAGETATNCARAREYQQGLQNSDRLYRVLANGGREFLTDEEVAAARENAANEVSRWCESNQ